MLGVRLYDITPAQVISLSVVMPGYSPGPSLQHVYCNQIRHCDRIVDLMKNYPFRDVLITAAHFTQLL